MPSELVQLDELEDLPAKDAAELRAFLEKERWFGSKLKLLEALAPIYPFLHPVLIPTDVNEDAGPPHSKGYTRRGEIESEWSLPSAASLERWREERDQLEEEVLTFDGGDLGRMKEKIRALTLAPLTAPSTNLTSITLALIVLVDRLLALLRRRSDLLELTSIRLQWDDLRWRFKLELGTFRNETTDLIAEKIRWRPPQRLRQRRLDSSPSTAFVMSSKAAAVSLVEPTMWSDFKSAPATLTSAQSKATGSPRTPERRAVSSHNRERASSAEASTEFSLLQAQLVDLQTRHRDLTSTLMSRSGQMLDRMMELAGPFSHPGPRRGPAKTVEEGETGALPNQILDVEEELEAAAQDAGNLLEYGESLIKQWECADKVHLALDRLQTDADDLKVALINILQQPAISAQHFCLAEMLRKLQAQRCSVRLEETPLPFHPSFSDSSDRSDEVMMRLRSIDLDVKRRLDRCDELLEWYNNSIVKRNQLLQQQTIVRSLQERLRDALHRLDFSTSAATSSKLDDPLAQDIKHTAWISFGWTEEAEAIAATAGSACQLATFAVLRLRQAITVPTSLRVDIPPPHQSIDAPADDVEAEVESLLRLMQMTTTSCRRARCIAQVLPTIGRILDASESVHIDIVAQRNLLLFAIPRVAYCDSLQDPLEDREWSAQLNQLNHTLDSMVTRPLATADSLLEKDGALLPRTYQHVQSQRKAVFRDFNELKRGIDLYEALRRQSIVVLAVREEAERFTPEIELGMQELAHVGHVTPTDREDVPTASPLTVRMLQLEKDVEAWRDGLSQRVPFISNSSSSTFTTENPDMGIESACPARHASSLPLLSSTTSVAEPPMTPPSSPPHASIVPVLKPTKSFADVINLITVDFAVRLEVNTVCVRVSAALSQLRDFARSSSKPELGIEANARSRYDPTLDRVRSKAIVTASEDWLATSAGPQIAGSASHPAPPKSFALATIEKRSRSALPLRGLDDVFSIVTIDRSAEINAQPGNDIDRLRARLNALGIVAMAFPLSTAHHTPPAQRRIPNRTLVDSAEVGLSSIEADFRAFCAQFKDADPPEKQDLQKALQQARVAIPRLHWLAKFASKVQDCDRVLSNFLDAIDAYDGEAEVAMQKQCGIAETAMKLVADLAQPLSNDPRVEAGLKRLAGAWVELQAIYCERRGDETVSPIAESGGKSSMIPAQSGTSQPTSVVSQHNGYRSTLGLPSLSSTMIERSASVEALRERVVSESPTRPRVSSLGAEKLRPAQDSVRSLHMSPSESVTQLSSPSRIPRPIRSTTPPFASHAATWTPGRTRGVRQSCRLVNFTPTNSTIGRAYVADPLNKLDVAVGTIINELNVDVPVVPVSDKSADHWKDQSGRYWIGAEGRAKLCFCRILRSRMVMVRVGGGWVELSKFLLDHFADSFTTWQPSPAGADIGSATPVPVTSASLASSSKRIGKESLGPVTPLDLSRPRTPILRALPLSADSTNISTASRSLSSTDQSLGPRPLRSTSFSPSLASPSDGGGTLAGPSSPLIPLHFIRRASESPPVLQREREKLKVGRRSILGREGSIGPV